MSVAQGTGWKIELVDDVPPVKPDWPATWKSIRNHFGITAFGINAVTKDAGNVLIPEHDESASGQQEIYFVHVGEVIVTLDGERHRSGGRRPDRVRAGRAPKDRVHGLADHGAGGRRDPRQAYEVGDWEK